MSEIKLVSKIVEALDAFIKKNPEVNQIKTISLLNGLKNRGVKVEDPIYKPLHKFIGNKERVDIKSLKNYLEENMDVTRLKSTEGQYKEYTNIPRDNIEPKNIVEDIAIDERFPRYSNHWDLPENILEDVNTESSSQWDLLKNKKLGIGQHSRYIKNVQTGEGKKYILQEIQYDAAQNLKNVIPTDTLPAHYRDITYEARKNAMPVVTQDAKQLLDLADEFFSTEPAKVMLKNSLGKTYNELPDEQKTQLLNSAIEAIVPSVYNFPTNRETLHLDIDEFLNLPKSIISYDADKQGKVDSEKIKHFFKHYLKNKFVNTDSFLQFLGTTISSKQRVANKFYQVTKGKPIPLMEDWWKYELNYNLANAVNEGHNIFEVILDSQGIQPRLYPSIETGGFKTVNTWYEKFVGTYLKKIANQIGAKYTIVLDTTLEGNPWVGKIEFPKDFSLQLYKPAIALASGVGISAALAPTEAEAKEALPMQEAINKIPGLVQQGYTEEQINKFFKEAYGISIEEAKQKVKFEDKPKMLMPGNLKFANEEDYDLPKDISDMVTTTDTNTILAQKFYEAKSMYSKLSRKSKAGFKFGLFAPLIYDDKELAKTKYVTNYKIGEILNKNGFEVIQDKETGDLYINNTGVSLQELVNQPDWAQYLQPLDESFLDALTSSLGEIVGAAAGASIGAAVLGLPGVIAVGGTGAAIGYAIDYLRAAKETRTKIDYKEAIDGAKYAGLLDALASSAIAGFFKLSGTTIKKAADLFTKAKTSTGIESERALKSLKEILGLTDDEIQELTINMAQQAKNDPVNKFIKNGKLNPDKAIESVIRQIPGSEALVRPASRKNLFTIELAKEIDARAKNLKDLISRGQPDKIGNVVINDLTEYRAAVKDLYYQVKQTGVNNIPQVYEFDLAKLTLPDVLESIEKNIKDPTKMEQFLNYIKVINNRTTSRDFEALVDLRQAINDFKYSKIIENKKDFDAINDVIKKIDGEISNVVRTYMSPEDSKAWLESWKVAKQKYAEMKQLESNRLFKVLTRPGITEDNVKKTVAKFAGSLDNTFNDIMVKLPAKTREMVETSIIDTYLEKNIKQIEGFNAINFEKFAEDLNSVKIGTIKGKELKGVVDELAKIYKNDPALSRASRGLFNYQNSHYITDNILVRTKFEFVNRLFDYIKRKMPTKQGRALALIHRVSKILENPMDAKLPQEIEKLVTRDDWVEFEDYIVKLRQLTANSKEYGTKMPVYGVLDENGKVTRFITDKSLTSNKTKEILVNPDRIATTEQLKIIFENPNITYKDLQDKLVKAELKRRGFIGYKINNEVEIFPEDLIE